MRKTVRNALGVILLDKDTPIGLHIRKKRLERQMNHEDAAKELGVTEACLWLWENLKAKPQIHHMPQLIRFLGYCPVDLDTTTLAGRIKSYRFLNGLSCESLGILLGVGGGAVSYWEAGGKPKLPTVKKIEEVIKKIG